MTRISEVVPAAHCASQTSARATQPTVHFAVGSAPAGVPQTQDRSLSWKEKRIEETGK